MKRLSAIFVAVFWVLIFSLPAIAHHGTSGYDLEKITMVRGTVSSFEWANPHCVVVVASKSDQGEAAEWIIELAAPGIMARHGWSKNSMKPGDQVIAETHPAKNGATSGLSGTSTILLKFIVNGQPLPSL